MVSKEGAVTDIIVKVAVNGTTVADGNDKSGAEAVTGDRLETVGSDQAVADGSVELQVVVAVGRWGTAAVKDDSVVFILFGKKMLVQGGYLVDVI